MLHNKSVNSVFVLLAIITHCILLTMANNINNNNNNDQQLIDSINNLDSEKSLYLFGGLSVEKIQIGNGRSMNADDVVVQSFTDRAIDYIKTHKLKFTVPSNDNVEEGRTGKLKKLALPLLLALKLKMAVILPVVLFGLALISFKGLTAGLLALLFSGATFVKDLLSKKQDRVTTAYITGGGQPVNAEIVHQDWNRNGFSTVQSPQELAYNYHTLPQTY